VRVGLAVVRVAYRARAVGRARSFGVGGSAYRPTALRDRLIVATTEQVTVGIRPAMGDRWMVGRVTAEPTRR